MTSSTDHITGLTGLTGASMTIKSSANGGAFTVITPTVSELGGGWYSLALTATHTATLGVLVLHITATGADPTDVMAGQVLVDLPGGSVTAVTGSVASVTAGVTVTTNNDKTGYTLSAAGVQAVWDALTSALTTVGSVGKLLVSNIDAAISSRLASASYTAPDNTTLAALRTDYTTTRASKIDQLDAAVSSRLATTGYTAPDNTTLAALRTDYTTTRAGKLDSLDATVSSRLASIGYTAPDNTSVAAIKSKTDNLPATPAAQSDVTTVGTQLGTLSTKIGTPAGSSLAADIAAIESNVLGANAAPIKKNTLFPNFTFPMTDTSGQPATGLTVTVQRSIDGGAFANCTNSVVEIGLGAYAIDLSAADLNGTVVILKFSATNFATKYATILTR